MARIPAIQPDAGNLAASSAAPFTGPTAGGRRIFITAAEVSGDQHAAELARSLRQLDPALIIEGLGGPAMRDAGVVIHHETVSGAAMLLRGAGRAIEMLKRLKWTRDYFGHNKPDLQICVDSSGVNLHFAKLAKSRGVPVLYYIAPQLWASRPGRIAKVRKWVDRVACILPFEEQYYSERRVRAHFVGHPFFDELPADRKEIIARRNQQPPIAGAAPVIGIIPGSRRSEVRANLPHLLEVAERIRQEFPGASFLIPTTPAVHGRVAEILQTDAARDVAAHVEFAQGAFDRLIPRCDLCLCKSGTSTLHVAAYGVPMIVVYRLSPLIWHLGGRWIIKTPKIALVNILAGNIDLAPEIVPWYGSNVPVAEIALDFLRHPEKLQVQRAALLGLIETLDQPGASLRAAQLAVEMMVQTS